MEMRWLENLTVQLEEAARLINIGSIARLRLAFMLIDNATETILRREVQNQTLFQNLNRDLRRRLLEMRSVFLDDPDFNDLLAEIECKIIPKKTLDKINWQFPAKVDFLVERNLMDETIGTILRKLHAYRNDMYHNMFLRKDALNPAALIYFDVACLLLAKWGKPSSYSSGESYDDLDRLVTNGKVKGLFLDIHSGVASTLRGLVGIDHFSVSRALIDHLIARLNELDEMITYVQSFIPDEFSSRALAIHLIHELHRELHRNDARTQNTKLGNDQVAVSESELTLWRKQVDELYGVTDKYEMFVCFARIEDAFNAFEMKANEVSRELEASLQREIDIRSGK